MLYSYNNFNEINETYSSIKDIKNLANDIFKEACIQTQKRFSKDSNINTISSVILGEINIEKYKDDKIKDFIDNAFIEIIFKEKENDDDKSHYETIEEVNYNLSRKRHIIIYYNKNFFKDRIKKLSTENITENSFYLNFFSLELIQKLIHEIQHAFDDFRSNHKFFLTKKSDKYFKKYGRDDMFNDSDDDNEIKHFKEYLNLPHEISARFTQTINDMHFSTFDWDEKGNMIYIMYPLENVIRDFKLRIKGFHNFPEKTKRKLISKLSQYWHKEQDENNEKIKKEKKIKKNKKIIESVNWDDSLKDKGFEDFVICTNKDDRDSGEIDDISEIERERLLKIYQYALDYDNWNNQGSGGYKKPSETSVLGFIQNNHEDDSHDKELQKDLLKLLKFRIKLNKNESILYISFDKFNEGRKEMKYNPDISKFKKFLSDSEMVEFIIDNNLKDSNGTLDYNDAKEIAYYADNGWTLTLVNVKDVCDWIFEEPYKTNINIPPIIISNIDGGLEECEVLDGKTRLGYLNYIDTEKVWVYLGK
jgi:hypothetical protein